MNLLVSVLEAAMGKMLLVWKAGAAEMGMMGRCTFCSVLLFCRHLKLEEFMCGWLIGGDGVVKLLVCVIVLKLE